MSLVEHTLFGERDKTKIAIERIRSLDPISTGLMDEPYYVAYSGGKDSDVLRILFELSNVKYELVHNHTHVDAPETVRYVRSIPGISISYPKITMWELIVKKGMPPTCVVRYCCQYLKEREGKERFVATGVRWVESRKRKKNRNSLEILGSRTKNKIILNADNTEDRRLFETCAKKGKRILNPIIDWGDDDVWEFLKYYGCQSNPLYQCGYTRVGCLGCPMGRRKGRERDFTHYPKYKEIYIHTFDRMVKKNIEDGVYCRWKSGEEVYNWWIKDPEKTTLNIPDQMSFSDMDEWGDWEDDDTL